MPQDELNKEPAYFSDKGSERGFKSYLELFGDAQKEHIRVGEASTAYLTDPSSAKRIFEFNRNAKIIAILRNPADRAYSLYRWMVQDGYEYAESFEEALELEKKRTNKNIPNWLEPEYYWNYMYFKSGLYSAQIKRYLDLFGDNLLVVDFEDFKSQPASEYMNICKFLEIEPIEPPYETHNVSKKVLSPSLQFILRKVTYDFISKSNLDKNITRNFIYSFLNNSWNLYKRSGKKINLNYSWTSFLRFREEISKANFRYCPTEKKEQRDFLLNLGTVSGKPPRAKEKTRKFLLTQYQEDIYKLELNLQRSFRRWKQ